jgi:hypothetical protein
MDDGANSARQTPPGTGRRESAVAEKTMRACDDEGIGCQARDGRKHPHCFFAFLLLCRPLALAGCMVILDLYNDIDDYDNRVPSHASTLVCGHFHRFAKASPKALSNQMLFTI